MGDTAYDIKCIDKNGGQHGINVPQLCREQNGNDPRTTYWLNQAKFTGGWVRDAWRCIGLENIDRPVGNLTGVMERYCASFANTNGLTLAGKTINDWYCLKNGVRWDTPIIMDAVCDWQTPEYIGDRIATWYWYDPYSAKCWM